MADDETDEDPRSAELDPPFPYRVRPVDWAWLRESVARPTADVEAVDRRASQQG